MQILKKAMLLLLILVLGGTAYILQIDLDWRKFIYPRVVENRIVHASPKDRAESYLLWAEQDHEEEDAESMEKGMLIADCAAMGVVLALFLRTPWRKKQPVGE